MATFTIIDKDGIERRVKLKDTLLAPTFPTNLFSVRAATDSGAKVTFTSNYSKLSSNGVNFNIVREGQLYFLQQPSPIITSYDTRPLTDSDTKTDTFMTKTLQDWHL